MSSRVMRRFLLSLVAIAGLIGSAISAQAGEILVVSRIDNSVYRYSEGGDYLGRLIEDNVNLNQPAGLTLSPDRSKLYVVNTLSGNVIEYNYDYNAATASFSKVFASGMAFPNTVKFSQDGSKVYVSQLGGGGVKQFNPDGSSAGAAVNGVVGGGAFFQFSGLEFAPTGELLVACFQDFPAGANGAVAKSNAAITTLGDFIGADPALKGAARLLVDGDALYVVAGDSDNVKKYQFQPNGTVLPYPGFVSPAIEFPASILKAPDGNGYLIGELGGADGDGRILRMNANGAILGTFVDASGGDDGFGEATDLTLVPEPSSIILAAAGLALIGGYSLRRRKK